MKRKAHSIVTLSALSFGLLISSSVLAHSQQSALSNVSSASKVSHTFPVKKARSENNHPATLLKRRITSSSNDNTQPSRSRLIHSVLPNRLASSS